MKTLRNSRKSPAVYDFWSSFLKTVPAALLSACMLGFAFFMSTLNVLSTSKIQYQMFYGNSPESVLSLTVFVLLAAGLLAPLVLFRFLGSIPQTNVLLSSGITKERLFLNRCGAGALALFLGVFIPLAATLYLNIRTYGLKSYMLKPWLLLVLSALAFVFIGFAAGTLTSVLAGSTAEAAAAAAVLPFFPYVLMTFAIYCCSTFLRGYSMTYSWRDSDCFANTYFLSPFHLLYNPPSMRSTSAVWEDFSAITARNGNTLTDPYTVLKVPGSLLTIFAAWLALCCLIIVLSFFLSRRRKAELNSHMRSSKAIAVLLSSFFVVGAAIIGLYFLLEYPFDSNFLPVYSGVSSLVHVFIWGSLLLPGLIALLVCLAVYAGSVKRFFKLFKLSPLCLLLTVIPLVCLFGGFGYTNRIPDAADIESVKISDFYMPGALRNFTIGFAGASLSDADKERVLSVFKKLTDDKDASPYTCLISYTLKNSKTVERTYYSCSADALAAIDGLFESDLIRTFLYEQLADQSAWAAADEQFTFDDSLRPRNTSWLIYGGASVSVKAGILADGATALDPLLTEDSFNRLLACYADDLMGLSSDVMFSPAKAPVCTLTFADRTNGTNGINETTDETTETASHDFYITAEMTKTLAFLKKLGVDGILPQKPIKEIALVDCANIGFVEPKSYGALYGKNASVETVTDSTKIKEITAGLLPYYFSDGQNLRYAYVHYTDGSIDCYLYKK